MLINLYEILRFINVYKLIKKYCDQVKQSIRKTIDRMKSCIDRFIYNRIWVLGSL